MKVLETAHRWALVVTLGAAALLPLLSGAAHADDFPPLPENVATMEGFPGISAALGISRTDPSVARDWIASIRAWIRAHALSPHVPALESAILEVRRQDDLFGGLAADYERVAGMYPATDPYAAVAWLRAAEQRIQAALKADRATWGRRPAPPKPEGPETPAGVPEAAPPAPPPSPAQVQANAGLKDLERGLRLADRGRPVDASAWETNRWGTLEEELVGARYLEAELLEVAKRRREAAEAYQEVAEDPVRAAAVGGSQARLWKTVARAWRLAGRKAESQAAIRRAVGLSDDPQEKVWFSMWQLYNDHDFLNARGEVGGVAGWPGEAFMDGARVMMRGLDGNPHLGKSLMSLGSTAFLNQENEAAVEFYLRALNDPAFMVEIAKDPGLVRALLVAFTALLQLERFEDAEEMLDILARLGSMSQEDEDRSRAQLEGMRESKARADRAPPEEEPPGPPTPKDPDGPAHLGTLAQRPSGPRVPDSAAGGDADLADGGESVWPWAALALLPLLVFGLVHLARRR